MEWIANPPISNELGPLTPDLAEKTLSVLVGLPLSDFRKPIFTIFEFGEQKPAKNRKGQDVTFADWILDCWVWQITKGDAVVLGWKDMPYRPKANHVDSMSAKLHRERSNNASGGRRCTHSLIWLPPLHCR